MPAGLQPLREQARHFLRQGLQRVFDAADDSLFEMGGIVAQQELFDVMRALRLKREGIEKSVLDGLDRSFREVCADRRSMDMDKLPAGLLSLVSHEELEESVAVKTMVMRSLSETGSEYEPLQRRLQALVGKPVSEDNNPLSARTLCTLMLEALRPLELKIQLRLLLLKLFEKHLLKGIGELYAAANDSLIAAGVLPDLQQHAPRPLRSAARERAAVAAPAAAEVAEPQLALGELRELLGQVRGAAPATPTDAVPVSQGDLTRLLSFLQRQPAAAGSPANLRQQLDALLARATANSPRPRVIGKLDEDVITLVSMLFEQVLADDALPEPLRGPIGEMQVPLLKAAILDEEVFAKQSHPARQLFNEVTVAARDSEELADIHRERLRGKIEQVSQRLREEFTDDPAVFACLLEDFTRFTASERKRAALLEQRLLEAEEARALREHARQQVDRLLSERLQGLTLPAAIVQGLERGWGGVLQLILLREGQESPGWAQAMATLDELLARVAPLRSLEEARLLLDERRNALLAELRRGLEQVAYDSFEQQRFFQELTQWQRKLLADFRAGRVEPAVAPMADQAAEPPVAEPVAACPERSGAVALEVRDEDASEAAVEIPLLAADEPAAVPAPACELPSLPQPQVAEPGETVLAQEAVAAAPVASAAAADDELPLAAAAETAPAVATIAGTVPGAEPPAVLAEESEAASVEEVHRALVDSLGTGSWIELHAESSKQRCKLAAFIRVTGQYIFVNRAGAKVATYDREGLAQAFASGMARLMDNAQPFDRALQAIIGNLREMRGA
ncbi:DUF1631 domain-containing protein [Pseudomonas stutzeri]|nr:DUF1631 domain-containing protein [Stutzerimonas stutzeri]